MLATLYNGPPLARGALLVLAAIGFSLAFAMPAQAAEPTVANLDLDMVPLAKRGAERTVRITLTNRGPQNAFAGRSGADPFYGPGDEFNGPTHNGAYTILFQLWGAALQSTSVPCEDYGGDLEPNPAVTANKICEGISRQTLAVGQSMSVIVRARITSPARFVGLVVRVGGDLETICNEDPNCLPASVSGSGDDPPLSSTDALGGPRSFNFRECNVPALKKKRLARAKKLLKAANCAVGKVKRKRARGKPGLVLKQSIDPGTRRRGGTKVALTVSKR